jgi:PAS domain-containing protein
MEDETRYQDGGEEAARSCLEAFRAVAELAPDLILRFDREFRHLYANPAAERRLRRPRHQIVGRTWRELGMPPEASDIWEEQLERVFRSGRERRFDFALGAGWLDGQEHFEARMVPEPGGTALVMVREVSVERRAQAALEERVRVLEESLRTTQAEQQLQRLSQLAVEQAEDAILWVDEDGVVVAANAAATRRFGSPLVGRLLAGLGLIEGDAWRLLQSMRGKLRGQLEGLEVIAHHVSLDGRDYYSLFVRDQRRLMGLEGADVERPGRRPGGPGEVVRHVGEQVGAGADRRATRAG